MALRTPLSVTPHLYMGDSTGRPLDNGVVYFGEQDKDPEFYPITLYSDDALTKPLMQPVHTKGGYLYDKGDMVEPHAKEVIYSVKVLDSYGRKVFYKGAMMRNSWNDDVIEQINTAIVASTDIARQIATDITNEAINNTAVEGGVLADTLVTATAIAPNAVARTQRDKNMDVISVKEFGAAGDALIDDTDALNAAFNYGRSVRKKIYVPDGTYRVDGTVLLNVEGIVEFSPRATLMRYSAYSTSTEPVFSMRGNHSECSGGRFITQNDSPKGVVTLGHLDNTDKTNALWWRIYNPYIQGVQNPGNIGLHIPSGQITHGDAAANYFGFIVNPIIRFVDEAIVFAEVANSHTVISPQIFQCITGGLNFYGAYGNQILGGFMHSSRNGAAGVRLMRDRGLGSFFHNSTSNSITNFGVEQGGSASKSLVIEEGCVRNRIIMNGNSAGGVSVPNEWSNEIDTGFYRGRPKLNFTSINVTGADGSLLRLLNERTYTAKIPASNEGDVFTIATALLQNHQSAIYEVNVLARNGALGYNTPKQYKFFVSKGGTGNHVIDVVDVNTTTKHAAILTVVTNASNASYLDFVLTNRNDGTGTTVPEHVVSIKHIAAMLEPGIVNGMVTINEEYKNI